MIGTVSAASFLALTQAVSSLPAAGAIEASTELASQAGSGSATSVTSQTSSTTSSSASLSSASQTCSLRCDKRCSYPGHCRHYEDTNHNGRCDFGECA